ncbi:protein SHORTAGE IN CHIASMATA 1 isoform X3 [Amborella trichopoda]|uniref:protein SHORTAGE IN CHIASMATA 1 isoform X3 n=1 Tax=Amborella trichopoda TaxID=13333 RepID=UPI0009BF312B|nr:protein SHORTAGE IN CHIASMATA 1 isoform X3 [Amborella trichopoda]|eukprot:XP_020527538.1 protein SHORTAGE IN CHIASMATA 1 isoform X3 [Amborella trichopoda]
MRTRFLVLDFFNHSSDTSGFTSLPVPKLPPLKASVFLNHSETEGEFCFFDCVFSLSHGLQALSFDKALSAFLSYVIPENLALQRDDSLEKRTSGGNQPKLKRIEFNQNTLLEEGKNGALYRVVHFETPEVDLPQEVTTLMLDMTMQELDTQEFNSFSCFTQDIFDFNHGDMGLHCHDFPRSIIEPMPAKAFSEKEIHEVENANIDADMTHQFSGDLTHFEVCEIGHEAYDAQFGDETFHSLVASEINSHFYENDIEFDFEELLRSRTNSMWKTLLELDSFEQCKEPHSTCLVQLLDMEYKCPDNDFFTNTMCSRIDMKILDGDSYSLVHYINFDKYQFLDWSYCQAFHLADLELVTETNLLEVLLKEDLNSVKTFNECIVGPELALADETFHSLPIPALPDYKELCSLCELLDRILDDLKPHSASACDWIYLDWHLSQEDKCNRNICLTLKSKTEKVDSINTSSKLDSTKEMVELDFLFLVDDELPDASNTVWFSKATTHDFPGTLTSASVPLTRSNPSVLRETNSRNIPQALKTTIKTNSENLSSLYESMSISNDLSFFIHARKGTTVGNVENLSQENVARTSLLGISSRNSTEASILTQSTSHKWNVKIHWINLCDPIMNIFHEIQKSCVAILENIALLQSKGTLSVVDYALHFSKLKLMDLIKHSGKCLSTLECEDENFMNFIALYALKQMAYYLCYSGIYTTHLYVMNLVQSVKFLKMRLSLLQSSIEDAHSKAEKGLMESHPSLPIMERIITLSSSRNGKKTLIVADRIFWLPLKKKLATMGMLYYEWGIDRMHLSRQNTFEDKEEPTLSILEALLNFDCLIISPENVWSSFPFNEFSIILEYGGLYDSSRVSVISTTFVGLPCIDFLKVNLDDLDVSGTLWDSSDALEHPEVVKEGSNQTFRTSHEDFNCCQWVKLLNYIPPSEKGAHSTTSKASEVEEASSLIEAESHDPMKLGTQFTSRPNLVIIVNTQNLDRELLISRRSSYQRILAMEKEGVQVVEREMPVPVDLVFSATMCLLWYTARKLGMNAPIRAESSSCMPLCIENIASELLMSLSFTFSDCILIFEGDSIFLGAVMESSDGLYAAAASLNMNLQLFFSSSSDLTDDIIESTIRHSARLNKCLYPAMLESETLAESFLTSFPSINPLLAHAVLSCGITLREFLEWTHEQRVMALRDYNVSEESVLLFSALCKYGDLGESKSGTTDCSSLSSAMDTDSSYTNRQSHQRPEIQSIDILEVDHMHVMPSKKYKAGEPSVSLLYQSNEGSNVNELHKKILEGRETKKQSYGLVEPQRDPRHGLGTTLFKEIDWGDLNSAEDATKGSDVYRVHQTLSEGRGRKSQNYEVLKSHLGVKQGLGSTLLKEIDDRARTENANRGSHINEFHRKSVEGGERKEKRHEFVKPHLGPKQGLATTSSKEIEWIDLDRTDDAHEAIRTEVIDLETDFFSDNIFSPMKTVEVFTRNNVVKESPSGNSNDISKLMFDPSNLHGFPTSAEITCDSDTWIPFTDSKNLFEEKNYKKPKIKAVVDGLINQHEVGILPDSKMEQTFLKVPFKLPLQEEGSSSSYIKNSFLKASQLPRPQQGSPWTIEFLNRIKEKSKMHKTLPLCNTYMNSPGGSRRIDKGFTRKSPSILEGYRYKGGNQAKKASKQKFQKRFQSPLDLSPREQKQGNVSSYLAPAWTPLDKRARQVLSFTRNGDETQSRLIWSDGAINNLRNKFQRGS